MEIMDKEYLLHIRFNNGDVYYKDDSTIQVSGILYPRQLTALNDMIQVYKNVHREDNGPTNSSSDIK